MACSREPWMRILFTCCLAESRALSVHKYMYVGYTYVHFEKDVCSARDVTQAHTEVLVRREYTSRHEERDIFAFGPRLGPRGPARLELLLPKVSLSVAHPPHRRIEHSIEYRQQWLVQYPIEDTCSPCRGRLGKRCIDSSSVPPRAVSTMPMNTRPTITTLLSSSS